MASSRIPKGYDKLFEDTLEEWREADLGEKRMIAMRLLTSFCSGKGSTLSVRQITAKMNSLARAKISSSVC